MDIAFLPIKNISIHSLRVEGDDKQIRDITATVTISIHSLRVEGDAYGEYEQLVGGVISIHSLRVEGDRGNGFLRGENAISIHSLRVEGDIQLAQRTGFYKNFNPLPPSGGRR